MKKHRKKIIIIIFLIIIIVCLKIFYDNFIGYQHHLWLENLDTGRKIKIDKVEYINPIFSNGDKYIYYIKENGLNEQIYKYNLNTKIIEKAFNLNGVIANWSLSMDRRNNLLFLSLKDEYTIVAKKYNIDTRIIKEIFTSEDYIRDLKIAPNGRRILYLKQNLNGFLDLYLHDLYSNKNIKIIKALNDNEKPKCPVWSNDSKYIAYIKTASSLVKLNSNGKFLDEIEVKNYTALNHIIFTKDSNKIIAHVSMSEELFSSSDNLIIIDLNKKNTRIIKRNRGLWESNHNLSNDGKMLVYIK